MSRDAMQTGACTQNLAQPPMSRPNPCRGLDHARVIARQGGAAAQQHASGGGTFNFWNMAATMADTVKASAAEIATTVKTTDWRAELGAFGKDVLDETEELGQSAVAAVEQAIDNVEQLPQQVCSCKS